jgi:hypothetical protein
MAIACDRLFTRPPLPPLPDFKVPRFLRLIALFTVLLAARPYLGIAPPIGPCQSFAEKNGSGCCSWDPWVIHADQDFGVALNPLVELFLSFRDIVNRDMMTHNFSRVSLAADDQIPEIFVVAFDWGLARGRERTQPGRLDMDPSLHTHRPRQDFRDSWLNMRGCAHGGSCGKIRRKC